MLKETRIGVLALQGGFKKHIEKLAKLGITAVEVRSPNDLSECDGLIIPGGESTVIDRLLESASLSTAIQEFGEAKPIFGTCAGLILLSDKIESSEIKSFNFINVSVERNAYGRQYDSFETMINLHLDKKPKSVPAIFIRAPKIITVGVNVQILASHDQHAVLVRQGRHLGATFHPELTGDETIHRYFIDIVSDKK